MRWLELPGLGAKEDLSDWAPKQVQPDALLGELIGAAPLFDADALDWRSQLKLAGRNAGYSYRGDIHNMSLALRYEPRLKDCFAWNDFRHRVEVVRKTPWCVEEWWDAANLTPVGHRALRDADMAKLGNYLTSTYDFGPCPMQACRNAIHAEAEDHIFDELKDWIGALPDWDGVARLDGLLVTYAGADPQAHSGGIPGPGRLEVHHAGAQPRAQPRRQGRLLLDLHRAPGDRQRPRARDAVLALLSRGHSAAGHQPGRFCPRHRRGDRRPRRRDVGLAQSRRRRAEGHVDPLRRPRPARLRLRDAAPTRGAPASSSRSTTSSSCRTRPATAATGPSARSATRVDIEGLRRDRDQILAEALARLKAGEQHWPTSEEEERLIVPERRKHMPEAALEVLAILARFIVEEPLTTRPNRGDFDWKWQRRPQPLRELYLDAFFEKCFGMYAAVKRQGLDRASKKDIAYCTTWLRENGWRRVQKRCRTGKGCVSGGPLTRLLQG